MKRKHLSLLALVMLLLSVGTAPFLSTTYAQSIEDGGSSTSSEASVDEDIDSSAFDEEDSSTEEVDEETSEDSETTEEDELSSDAFDSEEDSTSSSFSDIRIEGTIVSNEDNSTEIKFEIPSGLLENSASKAKVQVEFCMVSGESCDSLDSLPQNVQDELKNAKIKNVDLGALKGKLNVNMNGESHSLTNLTDVSKDGVVNLYNTVIEFDNTYDQFSSVEFVTVTLDGNLSSLLEEAQNLGKGFARINLVEDQGTSKVVPVYAQPKLEITSNDTPTEQPVTTPEEVKKVDTGIETNIALAMLALVLISGAAYKYLSKEE